MKRYLTRPLLVLAVCGVIVGGGAAVADAASSSSHGSTGQTSTQSQSSQMPSPSTGQAPPSGMQGEGNQGGCPHHEGS